VVSGAGSAGAGLGEVLGEVESPVGAGGAPVLVGAGALVDPAVADAVEGAAAPVDGADGDAVELGADAVEAEPAAVALGFGAAVAAGFGGTQAPSGILPEGAGLVAGGAVTTSMISKSSGLGSALGGGAAASWALG